MTWEIRQKYWTFTGLMITFVPFVLISLIQLFAYKALKQSVTKFNKNSQQMLRMKRVFKTFTTVAATFFCLSMPLSVYTLIDLWCMGKEFRRANLSLRGRLFAAFTVLLSLNTCANPLIYGRLHKKLMKLFPCSANKKNTGKGNPMQLQTSGLNVSNRCHPTEEKQRCGIETIASEYERDSEASEGQQICYQLSERAHHQSKKEYLPDINKTQ